jgi:hypothetical protein
VKNIGKKQQSFSHILGTQGPSAQTGRFLLILVIVGPLAITIASTTMRLTVIQGITEQRKGTQKENEEFLTSL